LPADVVGRLRNVLSDARVPFREITHEPTFTSEESARERGEALSVGAKALLIKTDDMFRLFVLPADRQVDSKAIKQKLGVRSVRFATREELLELSGLVPGSVPPFGEPVLPLELYADLSIGTTEDKVAFNAGSLTQSIVMHATDWITAAKPVIFSFAK
jgi:prolyl-tRNA editing enzyme YbaK/EbsC (Cys-tRNA(Pro) deacylase)